MTPAWSKSKPNKKAAKPFQAQRGISFRFCYEVLGSDEARWLRELAAIALSAG